MLNIPLLHNCDPTWSFQARVNTTRYALLTTLFHNGILRSMGDLVCEDGTWISRHEWITKIYLFHANVLHTPNPDSRILINLYQQLQTIQSRHFNDFRTGLPTDWKNTTQDEWNWPWMIENSHQEHTPFTKCSSKQLYTVLHTKPTVPHFFNRFDIEDAPPITSIHKLRFKRWISLIARNVLFRVQHRLLPLGYFRQHTNDLAKHDFPLCTHQVETYEHLFWYCEVTNALWTQQLDKWNFSSPTSITWANILFPSIPIFSQSIDLQSHELTWLWWIQVSAICHYIWTVRNFTIFEHHLVPSLLTQQIVVNGVVHSHLNLILHASDSQFQKSQHKP